MPVPRILVMDQDVQMKKRIRIRISGRRNRRCRGLCVSVTATGEFRDTVPGSNRWQLASLAGRANVDNDHVCRVPAAKLTTYLFRIL
jgi:hypothetical protein